MGQLEKTVTLTEYAFGLGWDSFRMREHQGLDQRSAHSPQSCRNVRSEPPRGSHRENLIGEPSRSIPVLDENLQQHIAVDINPHSFAVDARVTINPLNIVTS